MKLIIFLLAFFLVKPVFAADSTRSAEIYNKVLKIAETTAVKRTYSGTIKSQGTTSLVITTAEGDKTVTTNDVTSFFRIRAGNRTEINFKALKPGDDLVALGNIDPQNGEMTARQIIAKVKRQNLVGTLNSLGKIDLTDAVLKRFQNGKIALAKSADFKPESFVFIMAYQPDPTSPSLSALKALTILN